MSRWLLLLVVLLAPLAACGDSREVAVRVSIPGPDSRETPVPGVALVALPYDRDSIIAALEAASPVARPVAAERALDSLFAEFREPFTRYARAARAVSTLRDSLESSAGSEPPARLAALEREQRAARAALDSARARLLPRIDSLRAIVRHWEDSTYGAYDSIARGLIHIREPVADTTDAAGWASFELGPGQWWISGRSFDATDPNAEWYWNVPAQADTVLLTSRTGERQPRY